MSMTQTEVTVPQPLPVHSNRTRRHRWHVYICADKGADRGERYVIAEGRFSSSADSRAWADAVHPDAAFVRVDSIGEVDGWQPHRRMVRASGVWTNFAGEVL